MYGTVVSSASSSSNRSSRLDNHTPPQVIASPFRYQVQEGETITDIAQKTNTTVEKICELNPMLIPSHSKKRRVKVYPGQQLIVEEAQQVSLPPPPECIDNGWGQMHVVRAGESLREIAVQYNTTEEILRQDNRQYFPTGERGMLFPGQLLHVRVINTGEMEPDHNESCAQNDERPVLTANTTYSSSSAAFSKYKTHLVEKTDTFESICRAYNITYPHLIQINRGRYPVGVRAVLVVGERLIVPDHYASQQEAGRRNIAEVKLTKQIHIVEADETPHSIAERYHMTYDELREFNRAYFPKGYKGEIREGYKLVVKRVEHDEYHSIGGGEEEEGFASGRSVMTA